MANLFSLLNELRERIASSTSPSSSNNPIHLDEPLETKFRTILHGLLKSHVIPSSSANEREVIAVLKLLTHTARNFPAVFFHGKSYAVLPVIGRILPFFAEPIFLSWHGVIFETVGSLLSLLRTGDREAFRQFFLDTMLLVEGPVLERARVEVKNMTKIWAGRQLQAGKLGRKAVAGRSASQEISKSKVTQQLEGKKPLRLRYVQNPSIDVPTVKGHATNIKKGNSIGRNVVRLKTASKENDAGSMLWCRKTSKHIATEVLDTKGI